MYRKFGTQHRDQQRDELHMTRNIQNWQLLPRPIGSKNIFIDMCIFLTKVDVLIFPDTREAQDGYAEMSLATRYAGIFQNGPFQEVKTNGPFWVYRSSRDLKSQKSSQNDAIVSFSINLRSCNSLLRQNSPFIQQEMGHFGALYHNHVEAHYF